MECLCLDLVLLLNSQGVKQEQISHVVVNCMCLILAVFQIVSGWYFFSATCCDTCLLVSVTALICEKVHLKYCISCTGMLCLPPVCFLALHKAHTQILIFLMMLYQNKLVVEKGSVTYKFSCKIFIICFSILIVLGHFLYYMLRSCQY